MCVAESNNGNNSSGLGMGDETCARGPVFIKKGGADMRDGDDQMASKEQTIIHSTIL